MKHQLLLTAALTAFISVPASAFFQYNGLCYEPLNDSSVTVVENIYNPGSYKGDVVIPAVAVDNGKEYTVVKVDIYAFDGCTRLTGITFPSTLTTLSSNSFSNCEQLKTVDIPATLTDMDCMVFNGCSELTSINVSPENPRYTSVDGVVYNKEVTEMLECPNGKKDVKFPSTLNSIGYAAMRKCAKITEIVLPEGITSLGVGAFQECTSLKRVVIPGSVKSLGSWCFDDCRVLEEVVINEGLESTGSATFEFCYALTDIKFPNSLKTIGEQTFNACTALKSVTLGTGIEVIGIDAFKDCGAIEVLNILNPQPPVLREDAITDYMYEHTTLRVPEEALVVYTELDPWYNFLNIEPYDESSVFQINIVEDPVRTCFSCGNLTVDAPGHSRIIVMSVAGTKLGEGISHLSLSLGSGIYIVKAGDYSKKVLIK